MPEDFAPLDVEAEALVVDVDGFEGPLDLLLTLARGQRVDLRKVSILQLAEQYLRFVEQAQRLRIELAADYLVMAAWLAFLKSRLLLPAPQADGGPSGEEMAARLAWRLERLEAIRTVAARLMARDRLGVHVFSRGEAESQPARRRTEWSATLSDLLRAYAALKTREAYAPLHLKRAPVLALEEALARLREMLGDAGEWGMLAAWLPPDWRGDDQRRRSALASTFAATLELAKRGEVELRQDAPFAPLWLRRAARTRRMEAT
ncbi:MAG: ScpA family protein [Rubrimonas sp.]|uniref:segregation and condensation protein A n=1 Tax=Rubrimonas sp. TaxID=2036015 RepID=UPI002FDCCE68